MLEYILIAILFYIVILQDSRISDLDNRLNDKELSEYYKKSIENIRQNEKELSSNIKYLKSNSESIENKINEIINTIYLEKERIINSYDARFNKMVESSISKIISQGSKCVNKVGNESKILDSKIIETQGKMKRQLPIINERIKILEYRLNEIENKNKWIIAISNFYITITNGKYLLSI